MTLFVYNARQRLVVRDTGPPRAARQPAQLTAPQRHAAVRRHPCVSRTAAELMASHARMPERS